MVKKGDSTVHANGTVPAGEDGIAYRCIAHRPHRADVWVEQVALGGAELLGRLVLEFQRQYLGAQGEGLRDEILHISRWRADGRRLLDQLEILHSGITEHHGKESQGGVLVILRCQQEKFGLRQIDIGKAKIKLRLELAFEQRLDLVDYRLAGAYGLLRDREHGVSLQGAVKI